MVNLRPTKKKGTKPEIVAVGTEECGYFYFQKLGYLKTGEVLEVTKYEAQKKKGNVLISLLINKIAKDKGIDPTEAGKYIFPSKMADGTEVYPPDQESVLAQYPEEVQEFSKLQIPTLEIHNFIASLFLSGFYTDEGSFVPGRVAFQVEAVEEIGVNDEAANFEPVSFPLPDGSAIKFGNTLIRVNGNHDIDSEIVEIRKSPGYVAKNSTGFLFDIPTKNFVLGNEEWQHSDTIQLPEEMIDAIYEFYRSEAGLSSVEASEKAEETEQLGEQAPKTPVLKLAGETSTGESNVIEFPIKDSPVGSLT